MKTKIIFFTLFASKEQKLNELKTSETKNDDRICYKLLNLSQNYVDKNK